LREVTFLLKKFKAKNINILFHRRFKLTEYSSQSHYFGKIENDFNVKLKCSILQTF